MSRVLLSVFSLGETTIIVPERELAIIIKIVINNNSSSRSNRPTSSSSSSFNMNIPINIVLINRLIIFIITVLLLTYSCNH